MNKLTPFGAARQRVAPDGQFALELLPLLAEHDLGDDALYLTWELARLAGLPSLAERNLQRLLLASLATVRQGSTRLPIGGAARERHLVPMWRALGGRDEDLGPLLARLPALTTVCGRPGDYRPLILDGDWLYHERLWASEARLVQRLRLRLSASAAQISDDDLTAQALADVCARPAIQRGRPVELSGEQVTAVRTALASRLCVISGGPGTGKTSIVASLLRVLARLGVPLESVALTAPTGKAAHRMRESIEKSLQAIADPAPIDAALRCSEPRTLHRLLGFQPDGDTGGRFRHHENNRLAERVVILDEGSMVDLFLMDRLVRALREDACLVVLGDADQLPSVDAGAVFRDLVPCAPTAVRLTQSYRMDPIDPNGRNILTVAQRIRDGHAAALFGPPASDPSEVVTVRGGADELAFAKVELLGAEGRGPFLQRWFNERVGSLPERVQRVSRSFRLGRDGFEPAEAQELAILFEHLERFRLLCVTRSESTPTGTGAVNAVMHRLLLEQLRAALPGQFVDGSGAALLPGEPVMMMHNDYDRGLFNGDQGLILRVAEGGGGAHPMAVFPRTGPEGTRYAVFHLDSIRPSIEPAWAMTIHKSQGSEFDHVGVLIPDDEMALVTRELLYTAVTRSRRSVVLVGRRDRLEAGVAGQIRRFSGLGDKLGGLAPLPTMTTGEGGGGTGGGAPSTGKRGKRTAVNQLKLPF